MRSSCKDGLHATRLAKRGFTLIEILAASIACALILSAVYAVFVRAVKLRDNATERVRQSQMRMRAVNMLRNDLRNGRVSGGILAASLYGSREGHSSQFPGYLRFTTTTAAPVVDEPHSDIQEVEYYVAADPNASEVGAGALIRTVDTNLLAPVRDIPREEVLLSGVEAMEVEFYDGQSWSEQWEVSETNTTLPQAVRVRLLEKTTADDTAKAPVEVVVPWTTQYAQTPEPASTETGTAAEGTTP